MEEEENVPIHNEKEGLSKKRTESPFGYILLDSR